MACQEEGAVDLGPGGHTRSVVQDAESGAARHLDAEDAGREEGEWMLRQLCPGSCAARTGTWITRSWPRLPREARMRATKSSTDGALTTAGCRAHSAPMR
jgi:hypothetical protein